MGQSAASERLRRACARAHTSIATLCTFATLAAVGCAAHSVAPSAPPSGNANPIATSATTSSTPVAPTATTAAAASPDQVDATPTAPVSTPSPSGTESADSNPPDAELDESERRLLAVTAEIYPKDPALTAAILSRYVTCEVYSKYRAARQAAAQAELDISEAKKRAAEAERQANERAKTARRAAETARADLTDDYEDKVVSDRVAIVRNLTVQRIEPFISRMEIAKPVTYQLYTGYHVVPATRHLPETATVHPFDIDATLDVLLKQSDWSAIVKAWPGGCPSK